MTSPDPYNRPLPKPEKKSNALGVAILLACAIVVICSCLAVVGAMAGDDESDEGLRAVSTPNATATHAAPVSKAPAPKAKTAPAKPKPVTIGEGEWLVGEDVPAGRYRTPGAKDGILVYCSWLVTSEGGDGELLDAGSVSSTTAPGRATLKAGQEFQTSGCEPWALVK
jgi:hypothetical protein